MLEQFKKEKQDMPVVLPSVNMYEQNDKITLALEMPGADKETMDVHVEGNQLVIRGMKKKDDVGKQYQPLYQERAAVEYERRFEINTQIDTDKIEAQYQDGILKIALSKSETAQPRKIEIK